MDASHVCRRGQGEHVKSSAAVHSGAHFGGLREIAFFIRKPGLRLYSANFFTRLGAGPHIQVQ